MPFSTSIYASLFYQHRLRRFYKALIRHQHGQAFVILYAQRGVSLAFVLFSRTKKLLYTLSNGLRALLIIQM